MLFQGVSFSLKPGEALIVTGPNGIGKTSLLRILAGLARPEAGTVRLEPEGAGMHFLGSRDGLKSPLTVNEHLEFWERFEGDNMPSSIPAFAGTPSPVQGREKEKRASPLPLAGEGGPRSGPGEGESSASLIKLALSTSGLASRENLAAGLLSSGQRKRLALAKLALLPRPLWILDEPLNALDASFVEALTAQLKAHLAGGGLAVIATHLPVAVPGARMLSLEEYAPKRAAA